MSWSDQEALKHWADPKLQDLIINATPLDEELDACRDGDNGDSVDGGDSDGTIGQPTPVKDKDLTTFPYHSVGKLFWYDQETGKKIKYLSAFYIGEGKIMSAAHGFRGIPEHTNGFFIPAMAGDRDIYGKNYGFFAINPKSCHPHPNYPLEVHRPDFTDCNDEYDILVADVGKGMRNNEIVDIDDVGLTPIPIDKTEHHDKNTTWTAIGYTSKDGGRMKASNGAYNEGLSNKKRIAMNCRTSQGMNGGPWIHEGKANGCTSGRRPASTYSISPYFSESKLRPLNI